MLFKKNRKINIQHYAHSIKQSISLDRKLTT